MIQGILRGWICAFPFRVPVLSSSKDSVVNQPRAIDSHPTVEN